MTKNKIKTSAGKTNSGIKRGSLPDDFVSAQLSTSAASVAAMIQTGHFSKNERTLLDSSRHSNKTSWKWGDEILPSQDLQKEYANKKPQTAIGTIPLLNDLDDDDNHDQSTSSNNKPFK